LTEKLALKVTCHFLLHVSRYNLFVQLQWHLRYSIYN
jgi:hypothetical protein